MSVLCNIYNFVHFSRNFPSVPVESNRNSLNESATSKKRTQSSTFHNVSLKMDKKPFTLVDAVQFVQTVQKKRHISKQSSAVSVLNLFVSQGFYDTKRVNSVHSVQHLHKIECIKPSLSVQNSTSTSDF